MLFGRSATLRSHSAFFTWKKHEPYSGFSFNVSTKTSCSSSSFPTLSAGLRSARIFIAHSITLFDKLESMRGNKSNCEQDSPFICNSK